MYAHQHPIVFDGYDKAQFYEWAAEPCKRCSLRFHYLVHAYPKSNGPMTYKMVCQNCKTVLMGELKHEIKVNTLAEFVMPFGKHKGVMFKDIPRDYLIWCSIKLDKNIQAKAKLYLDTIG